MAQRHAEATQKKTECTVSENNQGVEEGVKTHCGLLCFTRATSCNVPLNEGLWASMCEQASGFVSMWVCVMLKRQRPFASHNSSIRILATNDNRVLFNHLKLAQCYVSQ